MIYLILYLKDTGQKPTKSLFFNPRKTCFSFQILIHFSCMPIHFPVVMALNLFVFSLIRPLKRCNTSIQNIILYQNRRFGKKFTLLWFSLYLPFSFSYAYRIRVFPYRDVYITIDVHAGQTEWAATAPFFC